MVLNGVVVQQVNAAVVSTQFEVAMLGVQPAVEYFQHRHLARSDVQPPRLGVGAVTGIALDAKDRFVYGSVY